MSGTNRLILSENVDGNEGEGELASDLSNANEVAIDILNGTEESMDSK